MGVTLRTMADLENYFYGSTWELTKADSVLSTGDSYTYNMVYGKKVWLQISSLEGIWYQRKDGKFKCMKVENINKPFHPHSLLVELARRVKILDALQGKERSDITKERISVGRKKFFDEHPEEREEIRQRSIGNKYGVGKSGHKGEKHPFYGKPRPDETKAKISKGMKGNKNCVGRIYSQETKDKIRDSVKKDWEEDHKDQLTEEGRDKQREVAVNVLHHKKKKRSNIELKLENAFIDKGVTEYQVQVPLMRRYNVDFLLSDFIVVECDGTYWHNLPNIIEKDKRKDNTLTDNGFVVIRFSENEINENPYNCVEKILDMFPFLSKVTYSSEMSGRARK